VPALRALDGRAVSATTVGGTPYGLATDGLAHLWVADDARSTVARLPR
jgi:hypothetical protein